MTDRVGFPTPAEAARRRRDAITPVLDRARDAIRQAMLKPPNGAGEHWVDWPTGLPYEAVQVLRDELTAAGWSLRTESHYNEESLVIKPREHTPGERT